MQLLHESGNSHKEVAESFLEGVNFCTIKLSIELALLIIVLLPYPAVKQL